MSVYVDQPRWWWVNRDLFVVYREGTLRAVHLEPGPPEDTYFKYVGFRKTWNRRTEKEETLLRFDVRQGERYHWIRLKKFLCWLFEGKPFYRTVYKSFRRSFHESKERDWDDPLPSNIVRWASREIQRQSKGFDCVDNSRVAKLGNTSQMRRYRRQRKLGCCGSSDWEAVGPDGKVYLLGFNFGH